MTKTFTGSDGDAWYERNKDRFLSQRTDPIVKALGMIRTRIDAVLEVGCSTGYRLEWIRDEYRAVCYGVDVSRKAISIGSERYPELCLKCGDITRHLEIRSLDVVIFGFCLYLIPPEDLFVVAQQADSMLDDLGYIVIWDYNPEGVEHLYRPYRHGEGIWEHHMDFSRMFTWNPNYKIIWSDDTAPEGPVMIIKKGGTDEDSEHWE